MLQEIGHCKGIENYTRHLSGAAPGQPPATMVDYLPKDALMFLDESHVMIGQLGGMYNGDRARKTTLVEYGFRLPSALDNRPLKFEEFEAKMRQAVFVSATPATYEKQHAGQVVEQLVRPTGLIDPVVEVRPATHQVDDVLQEIRERVEVNERVLITTLTKRMAEQLTDYLADNGVKVRYLHSDIETVERVEILRDLRLGTFDVLVGINLLREGLDIPEVSLVAILDADKEGLPALRAQPDPDDRPGGAQPERQGDPLRRPGDRLDEAGDRRDRAPPRPADRRTTWPRASRPVSVVKKIKDMIDGVYSDKSAKDDLKRSPRQRRDRGDEREGPRQADQAAREADARARPEPRVREGGAAARPAGGAARAGVRRAGRRQRRGIAEALRTGSRVGKPCRRRRIALLLKRN